MGGRQKGTPNKVTIERRALIASFIEENWQTFKDSFELITDPDKKCSIFMQMMAYYAPKLASVDYKDKTPIKTFNDELDELSGEKTRK